MASTPTYSRPILAFGDAARQLHAPRFVLRSFRGYLDYGLSLGIVFGGGIGDDLDFLYFRRSNGREAAVVGKLPTVNPDHSISDTENGNLLFLVDSYSCHFVQQVHCGSRLSEDIVGDIHRIMPRACGEYRTAGCHGDLIDQNRLRQQRYVQELFVGMNRECRIAETERGYSEQRRQ